MRASGSRRRGERQDRPDSGDPRRWHGGRRRTSSATRSLPRPDAYEIEAALLDVLRLLDEGLVNDYFNLTNKVWGHHHEERGLISTRSPRRSTRHRMRRRSQSPRSCSEIPRLWTPRMTEAELFDATHGWW